MITDKGVDDTWIKEAEYSGIGSAVLRNTALYIHAIVTFHRYSCGENKLSQWTHNVRFLLTERIELSFMYNFSINCRAP